MIKSLLIALVLALVGCSFSKDTNPTQAETVQRKRLTLTAAQQEIINSVERKDMASLTQALSLANSADYNFSLFKVTPMSVALQNDSLEFVKFILEKNLDPFNLGEYQSAFDKNTFNYSLKRALDGTFLAKKDSDYILNRSEKYLLVQIKDKVKSIAESIINDKRAEGKALFVMTKLSCKALEIFSILQNYRNLDISQMLSDLNCSASATPAEVEALFQLELRRGFQRLFVQTKTLDFLMGHPNLNSQMWEIAKNLWVSPDLLFRISRSAENYSINQNFCKIMNLDECMYVELNPTMQEQGWHPQKSKFELIYLPSLDPSVTGQKASTNLSFSKYPYTPVQHTNDSCMVLEKEDTLYAQIALYLNGFADGVHAPLMYILDDENDFSKVELVETGSKPNAEPGQALKEDNKCRSISLQKIEEDSFEDFELSVSK
ncbi:hypothetical protein ACES2L_14430 [Bdellovibrio bacteriovorus]